MPIRLASRAPHAGSWAQLCLPKQRTRIGGDPNVTPSFFAAPRPPLSRSGEAGVSDYPEEGVRLGGAGARAFSSWARELISSLR
jgi:hypothetical protein